MKKFLLQFFLLMGILLLALDLAAQSLPSDKQVLVQTKETKDTIFMYSNSWHKCNWLLCPYQNKAVFRSHYNKRFTDGYEADYMDSLHFYHPNWTQEQIFIMVMERKEAMQHANI